MPDGARIRPRVSFRKSAGAYAPPDALLDVIPNVTLSMKYCCSPNLLLIIVLSGALTAVGQTVTSARPNVLPAANPADDSRYLVRQHYLDFLGRVPDAGGLNF